MEHLDLYETLISKCVRLRYGLANYNKRNVKQRNVKQRNVKQRNEKGPSNTGNTRNVEYIL